mmetsp:Transcript_3177/g.7454  ORF Transcript_3177/g.7454 Transcript_3177/m.7454 type:complete len:234 (+) Transcript_3177:4775-5476(+)
MQPQHQRNLPVSSLLRIASTLQRDLDKPEQIAIRKEVVRNVDLRKNAPADDAFDELSCFGVESVVLEGQFGFLVRGNGQLGDEVGDAVAGGAEVVPSQVHADVVVHLRTQREVVFRDGDIGPALQVPRAEPRLAEIQFQIVVFHEQVLLAAHPSLPARGLSRRPTSPGHVDVAAAVAGPVLVVALVAVSAHGRRTGRGMAIQGPARHDPGRRLHPGNTNAGRRRRGNTRRRRR